MAKGKTFSFQKRLRIYWRDAFTCQYCHRPLHPLSEDLTLDHVEPKGGDDDTNLVTACRSCNSTKGARLMHPILTREAFVSVLDTLPRPVDVEPLIKEVARLFGVDASAMISTRRDQLLVRARAHLAHELRERGLSLMDVARVLGRKDHGTIIHLLKTYPRTDAANNMPVFVDKIPVSAGDSGRDIGDNS